MSQPTTREELYQRIRQTSRDEVVLEEMIRLGFWPAGGKMPCDPAAELQRRKELEAQLRALVTEQARLADVEAVRRAMRKQRMEASRQRRAENKRRRLAERQERQARWQQRKSREILYLGEDVSGGLNDRQTDADALAQSGLPTLENEVDLARAMNISLGELRFLAFARRTSKTTHYQRFKIRKKTGGERLICAPMPRLKRAQHWILHNILEHVTIHEAAHGFRPGRSIVSNARPHVAAAVVVNLDLEDFFPTVSYRRIKGVFRKLGYSGAVSTILAVLCSEPQSSHVRLDGEDYFVARSERFLPQGAPTSPAITNIICRGLDARLSHLGEKLGFAYTRYADDLTFSGPAEARAKVGRLLRRAKYVIVDENFKVHPAKTRVLRRGRRQEVTGLVVNDRVNVPRRLLRKFRAVLFQIERDGPAGKRWGSGENVMESIEGFARFVRMVDAEKGRELLEQVHRLIEKYGRGSRPRAQRPRWQPPQAPQPAADVLVIAGDAAADSKDAPPQPQKKPWWKFW